MVILTVDIGNTVIDFACVSENNVWRLGTVDSNRSKAFIREGIEGILGRLQLKYRSIDGGIMCSVVPSLSKHVRGVIDKTMGMSMDVTGETINIPMKNKYSPKSSLGQDRLVSAFAAKELYGAPAIVIDLGTATTFDVISSNGSYEGGIIVPGIRLSAESLFKKTELLPNVDFNKTSQTLIGRSTRSGILSGLFHGYGVMCAGLIDKIRDNNLREAKVVVTGGYTYVIKKCIADKIYVVDKDLVFRGLYLIASTVKSS